MALVLADRVKETSTTTGTITYVLAGAVDGFESFASIGNGNTTYYACIFGSDFEVGIGTYTASGTTLARTTILQSSNSDNAVNWGSGTKTLFCTQPAEKAVFLDSDGNIATFNGSNLTNVNATQLNGQQASHYLDYGNFTNTPTIPTNNSELTNGAGYITSVPAQSFASLTGKPTTISGYGITDAFDGAYGSLTGTPTIPTNNNQLTNGAGYITSADGGNAQTLNSLDSTQFLRSDQSGTITGDLIITSTDAGATEDPSLDLYRNSANPDVSDVLGHIDFSGMNDAITPEKIVYAKINADIADESNDTEDGRLDIQVISNGTVTPRITVQGNGHTLFQGRDVRLQANVDLVFEGSVVNGTRTTLTVVNPNQANTITLPDVSGTVLTTGNSDAPTTTTSSGDADFVLIDDGGVMKKITPTDLGVGGGGGGGITTGKAIAMAIVFG